MYLVGKGHEHMGPGTSLVQRYDWTQADSNQLRGLGCGCGRGLGCVNDIRGNCGKCRGMGLFDSGMDPSGWGWPEFAIVGLGVYAGLSLIGDTRRGVQRTHRVAKAVRKAA